MPHINIQPPGVMHATACGRKRIYHVISGDTWSVSATLYDPIDMSSPATPDTTFAQVVLSETQFDKALWTGDWFNGLTPDENRPGLVHIRVPNDITRRLRRGSYQFSVRVSDLLKTTFVTEAEGSFLVEYKPTSDNHSIPYKDGTGDDYEEAETYEYPRSSNT